MKRQPKTREIAAALALRGRREMSDLLNAAPPYRMLTQNQRAPEALTKPPKAIVKGDKAYGAALLGGRFALAGEIVEIPEEDSVWDRTAPSKRFAESLHRFDWLADLLAVEDPEAPLMARRLADDWLTRFGKWNWFSWEPHILEGRLWAWMMASETLFSAGDENTPKRLKSAVRQTLRLSRCLSLMPQDKARLFAAITLRLAMLTLDLPAGLQARSQAALDAELTAQLLPDGGHASRNPRVAADVLIALVVLDQAADARGVTLSAEVSRAMDRAAAFIRFCRLPSGGLCVFHGGDEGDSRAIETALKHVGGGEGRGFNVAPHSGYNRVQAGGAVLIMDSAGPPKGPHSADVHASALAFEFAAPGGRLVVNCGWSEDQPRTWREAVRATAAHSVLTLEETSSTRLLAQGWQRSLLGPRVASGPEPVKARRNEEDLGVWLEASHEGYRRDFGLSLRRRLFLASDGGDLRGEDSLFRPVEDGAPDNPELRYRFSIRFHLHPSVRASLSRDSLSALLVAGNGDGWRFRTDGGPVRLERSVYLAAGGKPERSTQLVVSGEAEPYGAGERPPNRVRWAFQRLGRVGAAG
ncbi:heparinase II/III family protein [Oceanicaulis sp. UBA2681]|uniref:heparinase II/III family protein n=1 Tax=Oceanicaulis sp. UBA2681 TaxID=1947007 RepID=UPI00257D927A|nr:heparinase II/III family protein [Oceanicaulis sp. UBA2681]